MNRVSVLPALLFVAGCSRGFMPQHQVDLAATPPIRLSWNRFPTPDYDALKDRVSDIQYELRIWEARPFGRGRWYPGRLAYSASSLPEPLHVVAEPLPIDTPFVWAVRARFTLDGQSRATPWSTRNDWSRGAELPELEHPVFLTGTFNR